jgi:SAM-dependent methyltransferase
MSQKMNPWDERYSLQGFYYGTEANDFLIEKASLIPPGGRVLCLAEGEGRNAVWLASLGFQVTAVDQSRVGLSKLLDLARERGVLVETIVCDLNDYDPGEGVWDAVVSIWCHVPPELRGVLHSKVIRGLKPGGVVILEAYHPRQLGYKTGGPPNADLMMTKVSLEHEFSGLRVLDSIEKDRVVQEGRGHSGLSAVVQFTALKS